VADASFSWSSSNASVAQVDGSGRVSAVAAGNATITATSGGRSGTAQVTVNAAPPPPPAPVVSVEVTPSRRTLEVGGSFDFDAIVRAADGTQLQGKQVSWNSSAPSVASVDGNGLVTAKKAGEATITATSEGKSGTAEVTVNDPPPPPAPAKLEYVSGDDQEADGGKQLKDPLVVRIVDAQGSPVAGVQVRWSTDDGSLDPQTSVTDENGRALTRWTLAKGKGKGKDEQEARATVDVLPGQEVIFTATVDD
jgi:hypothetical protein